MELHEGVIIVFAVTVCSIVVHKVYRFAMRGKTYEEAIAEQRNMPLEHLLLGRGKDKNKDKKTKKVGKKVKEKPVEKEKMEPQVKVSSTAAPKGDTLQKNQSSPGGKPESVTKGASSGAAGKQNVASPAPPIHPDKHRAVEFGKPEAEVVNDQGAVQQEEGKSKKKKKSEKGMKPILLNRDEVSPVDVSAIKDEPETPRTVNHFEESKPKDEFIKRKHSKEETTYPVQKPKEKVKGSEKPQHEATEAKVKVAVVEKEHKQEERAVTEVSAPQMPSASAAQSDKEVSSQDAVLEDIDAQIVQQPPVVSTATSGGQENKRKKKKNDLLTLQQMSGPGGVNVSLLEPLIHKADLSRSEVQNLIDLLLNKQQESATENSEWMEGRQDPVIKLKKQLAEKEKALTEEQEASQQWQTRIRELRTELNAERTRLTANVRKAEVIVAELTSKLQNESDSHNNEKRALHAKLQELQDKINEEQAQNLKTQEMKNQAIAALQQELSSQRSQIDAHVNQVTEKHEEEKEKIVAEMKRLQEKLASLQESKMMLSTEIMQVQEALRESQSSSEEECKRLREVAANAEAAANSSREMARHYQEDVHKSRVDHEKEVNELKAVVSSQKMREAELQAELKRVMQDGNVEKERLEVALNEADERTRRAEEALARVKAEFEASQQLVEDKDPFIKQLSNELEYYKTEIPRLSNALEAQKKKNDELRQKNWNVMDALQASENSLIAHMKNSQNSAIEDSHKAILEEQERVKQILQRFFPSVTVPSVESYSEWVEAFESSVSELQKENQSQPSGDCEAHLNEIQILNSKVAHYLNIVKETESMLSTLQNTVENQEASWSEQLRKKEEELKQITSERDDLALTLEDMQSPTAPPQTQEKLQELQTRLVLVEEEKKELTAQCDNLQKTQSDLEKECTSAKIKVEELQKKVTSLSTEVNVRQEKNDDLSKELVKLNSLVKIGQDSLNQEQNHVKEMAEELEKLKAQTQNHTATNGPASESSISESLTKEVKSPSNAVSSSELPNMDKKGKNRRKKGGSAKN